jgi:hypothetical protein
MPPNYLIFTIVFKLTLYQPTILIFGKDDVNGNKAGKINTALVLKPSEQAESTDTTADGSHASWTPEEISNVSLTSSAKIANSRLILLLYAPRKCGPEKKEVYPLVDCKDGKTDEWLSYSVTHNGKEKRAMLTSLRGKK